MRHLVLDRPLVFLDFETTGVSPFADRIVELSMIKVYPDDSRVAMTRRVNPGVLIPPDASRIHGITDAAVADAPPFTRIADELLTFIGAADLAGFNIHRFDLPLLHRELALAGRQLEMEGRAVVDAQVIYHRRVPRDLAAAYRLYCGKELVGAHGAAADIEACVEVLDAQLAVYPDLPRTPRDLYELFAPRDASTIDTQGRFRWDGREAVFGFGPEGIRGRPLRDVAANNTRFLGWILRKDFRQDVKVIVQNALRGRFPFRR